MLNDRGRLNEEVRIKLSRRDILLLMLCVSVTHNHTKGGALLFDLNCLREKLIAESDPVMYSTR